MSSIENQGGDELDPKRCSYVYPEGHVKAGQQCRGSRGAGGYCGGHANALRHQGSQQGSDGGPADGLPGHPGSVSGLPDSASPSLATLAGDWMDDPATHRALRSRWNKILRNGADADVIRMVKELNDARPDQAELEIPTTVREIHAMSTDELEAALRQLEREGY